MENYTYILLLLFIHMFLFFIIYILTIVCFYYTFIIKLENIKYNDEDSSYESIEMNEINIIEKNKHN